MALTKATNRMITGAAINVLDYGAVGDGVTDDTAAIQAAIDAANGNSVHFESGANYLVTSEIDCHTGSNGPSLYGNGCTITAGGSMQSVLFIGSTTTVNCQLYDINIDANNNATYGLYAILVTEQDSLFQNIRVGDAVSHGMYLDGCQVMRLHNLRLQSNGGDGLLLESCNGLSGTSIRATNNGGNGITIQRGTRNYTGGCQISDTDCEINTGHGISVVDTASPVTLVGGWMESNVGDGVNIGSSARGVTVYGYGIIGVEGGSGSRAIRVQNGAAGCELTNNKFQFASGGTSAYSVLEDENTSVSATNKVYPNYSRSNGNILNPVKTDSYIDSHVLHEKTTTVSTRGMGGFISGYDTTTEIAAASGTKTFKWTPSGTFNIPGANDRGAYFIELDMVGYFAGIDQPAFIRAHIFAGTLGSSIYDASSTIVYSYGDTRKSNISIATPTNPGSSAIQVVVTNSEPTYSFKGTITWRTVMTTTGQLSLTVT